MTACRHLVVVLGDQLDPDAAAFDGFDRKRDAVFMAEVAGEAEHVWSTKPRITVFLAAMRHFRETLRDARVRLRYSELDEPDNTGTLAGELDRAIRELTPERLIVTEPGEWRVLQDLKAAARRHHVALDVRTDRHFLCTFDAFREHAAGRRQLRLEYFYREQRRRHGILLDEAGHPVGGRWNFDAENRGSFGRDGPQHVPPHPSFSPDTITRAVIDLVNRRFADHPGSLDRFDWPVTPAQAERTLEEFIAHRLARFGDVQDAMWTDQPFLFHSRLSSAMNLKLLDPRRAVSAAELAYRQGRAPLASVEGFVRQILGWREYVRGIYWLHMPEYIERNALGAHAALPDLYWTGDTDMRCMRETVTQTLALGYAHHIQRLMVTGLFAMLFGVEPRRVHEWYLAVYVDAVEWVELPNTLGMSQYGDGGVMGSKPYAASGRYIDRMSNLCRGCRFDPKKSTGEDACPFTTMYWDFLFRHRDRFAQHPRMKLQIRNAERLDRTEARAIRAHAGRLRERIG